MVRAVGLNRAPRLHHAVAVLVTFQLVAFAWILFRATSFGNAWAYVRYLQFRLPLRGTANLIFDIVVVLVLLALEYGQRHRPEIRVLDRTPIEVKAIGYALFVVILIAFSVDTTNAFIYFKF